MIYAEIKSKIPEVKYREDVLTSNVFTFFKVLPENYLLKLICNIVNQNVSKLLKNRRIIEFSLWKKFSNLKEPEIYIKFEPEYHVFIEVKYCSPESGDSQLKDYLDIFSTSNKHLIYLTADRTEPVWTTQKEAYKGLPISWINWYKFKSVIEDLASKETNEIVCNIYNLIIEYLNYKKFSNFDGWSLKNILEYMKKSPNLWSYNG